MQIEVTTHKGTKVAEITEYLTRDENGFYHNIGDTTMTQTILDLNARQNAIDTQQWFNESHCGVQAPVVCTGCHDIVADNDAMTWAHHFHTCKYYNGLIYKAKGDATMPQHEQYYFVAILPHHSGFGMWDCQVVDEPWAMDSDLIHEAAQDFDAIYELGSDKLPVEIEDIRGHIYSEPERVFVGLRGGRVDYWGITSR